MTEVFNRGQEICANQFDDKGQTQLTDLLRQEFLSAPASAHHYGDNKKELDGGKVTLHAFFQADGKINDIGGMVAVVKCDEANKYVVFGADSKGEPNRIDVAKNGHFVSQDHILTIHGK